MGQQFKKIAFYTLGCKLNFSETSTITRGFLDAGYARVDFEDTPDIYVINTCSVTDNADKKCRALVRKAKKINPDSKVVMIGCYAQLKPKEISQIEGVSLVLGANEKFNIIEHLESDSIEPRVLYDKIKYTHDFIPSYSAGDRTRSFLKVQDGCDYFCSFCTIPLARGKSRSQSVAETMEVAKTVVQTGVKEIVLTGVNIGDFGAGTDETFLDLVKELDTLANIDRIRISSIEPNLLNNDIIDYTTQSKLFVPHFHIPLQSGNDTLLKKMRRRYDRQLYEDRIKTIKARIPDCCIGVDVIVGFPGETDELFQDTFDFLHDLDVSYLHVFTYSERANTTAVRMEDVVPVETRRKRSKQLQILSQKKKRLFYEQYVGETRPVLFEASDNNGFMNGFTDNYIKVKTPYNSDLTNRIVDCKLKAIDTDGVFLIETPNI